MGDDWYQRDVRAAINGMLHLTLEERGAYNTLIDHQYLMSGPLHDDDQYIAGLMGCDVRIWKRIKKQLLAKNRIEISDGRIADVRASYTIASRQATRSKRVAAGQLGGIASGQSRKNKALAKANASPPSNQIREEEKREKKHTKKDLFSTDNARASGENTRAKGNNPRAPNNPNDYTPEFEALYAMSRNKGAKAAAWREYGRVMKLKQITHAQLLECWKAHNAPEREYPVYLRTFLKDGHWEDDPQDLQSPSVVKAQSEADRMIDAM